MTENFSAFFLKLFLLPAFFAANALAQSANHPDRAQKAAETAPTEISSNERALFDSLNHERASRGLSALHWDARLASAAQLHAQRMAGANNLSHQLPGEPELLARLAAAGAKFSGIAENIAEGSDVPLIHDGWMHSPGHRANILDPQSTAVGIAVVRGKTQLFAVQDFSRAVESLDLEQQEKKVSKLLAARGLKIDGKSAEARKSCDANVGLYGVTAVSLLRFEAGDLDSLPAGVAQKLESRTLQRAIVGACPANNRSGFANYRIVILLY